MYPVLRFRTVATKVECSSEKPRNCPLRDQQFHLESFWSFCNFASRTNTLEIPKHENVLVTMIGLSFSEYFHRRNPWFLIWYSIEHPNWVLDGKIPKCEIIDSILCTMQWWMNHKRPFHIHDGLDGALCSWVLIMSSNTGEALSLALALTILVICVFYEYSIITVVIGDFCNCLLL